MTRIWLQIHSTRGDAGNLMRQRKKKFFSFNKECFNKEFCFAEHLEFISRVLLRNPGCHTSEGLDQGMEKWELLLSDSWISLVKVDFEGVKPQHLQAALIVGWVSSPKENTVIALWRGSPSWWACCYSCGDIWRGPGPQQGIENNSHIHPWLGSTLISQGCRHLSVVTGWNLKKKKRTKTIETKNIEMCGLSTALTSIWTVVPGAIYTQCLLSTVLDSRRHTH